MMAREISNVLRAADRDHSLFRYLTLVESAAATARGQLLSGFFSRNGSLTGSKSFSGRFDRTHVVSVSGQPCLGHGNDVRKSNLGR